MKRALTIDEKKEGMKKWLERINKALAEKKEVKE